MQNNYKTKKISKNLIFIILISFSLFKLSYSVCNPSNCPPLRGICSQNRCVCEEGYMTVNNKIIQNNGVFCNYHLKSRFIAFLLEFFFPFGVGHFYSGKTILAVVKLGIFVLLICSCCTVLICLPKKDVNACSVIVCLIVVLCIIGLIFMEIFDLVSYGLGIYNDGNGIEMS